jgi:hypothetical protein
MGALAENGKFMAGRREFFVFPQESIKETRLIFVEHV